MSSSKTDGRSSQFLDREQVVKAVSSFKLYLSKLEDSAPKKSLVSVLDDDKIQLQFSYKQIPRMARKNIKVLLDHSFVRATTSVCLFVKDLHAGREYEKTVEQYERIFTAAGLTQSIDIFPLKKLKLEYGDFEAKRNLSNAYDVYLCDARITRLLPPRLGKHFIARHRFPLQVRLEAKDLKEEIQKALSTSQCVLSGRGSSCQMTVGLVSQSDSELADNILRSIEALCACVPGGGANIRNLLIKTADSKSLPIFLSLGGKDLVKLETIRRPRETPIAEDVTTVLGAKVSISSRGIIRIVSEKTGGLIMTKDIDSEESTQEYSGSDSEAVTKDKTTVKTGKKTKQRSDMRENKAKRFRMEERKTAKSAADDKTQKIPAGAKETRISEVSKVQGGVSKVKSVNKVKAAKVNDVSIVEKVKVKVVSKVKNMDMSDETKITKVNDVSKVKEKAKVEKGNNASPADSVSKKQQIGRVKDLSKVKDMSKVKEVSKVKNIEKKRSKMEVKPKSVKRQRLS